MPLAIAGGAGSGAQNAIGIGVIGGVVAGTVLAVLFVPLFFVLVLRLFRTRSAADAAQPSPWLRCRSLMRDAAPTATADMRR